MGKRKDRVCPVSAAGSLDTRFRRWFQNPRRLLGPYVREGMTVVDFGCGPGFFTLEAARMVGEAGQVVAVDLQEGMLERLGAKLESSDLKARITLHKCDQQALGVSRAADFVLAVYVIHELPEGHTFFAETRSLLNPGGHLLIVEPIFHVSKRAFAATVGRAEREGLTVRERPRIWLSRAALLQKA